MKQAKWNLGPRDSAVIFKSDGEMLVIVAEGDTSSFSRFNAMRCATLYNCPEALRLVDALLEQERAKHEPLQ